MNIGVYNLYGKVLFVYVPFKKKKKKRAAKIRLTNHLISFSSFRMRSWTS